MSHRNLLATLLAISLSSPGISFAQHHGNNGNNGRGVDDRGGHEQNQRGGRYDRRDDRAAPPLRGYGRPPERRDDRGGGPDHNFRRGDQLPDAYRSNQYVVNDWRSHHLSAPPRGCHWVQTGGDYVLVAIATGIILQLLLNN